MAKFTNSEKIRAGKDVLKKTITYKDFLDNDVTEDFYFNMTKMELAEMEVLKEGGLREHLTRIITMQDRREILNAFKDLISATVGRRSEDGKRFEKSEKITNEFMQTDAYSELVISFFTNPNAAVEFISGVMPKDLVDKVDMSQIMSQPLVFESGQKEETQDPAKKIEDYSFNELESMPYDLFLDLLAKHKGSVSKPVLSIAMRRAVRKDGE